MCIPQYQNYPDKPEENHLNPGGNAGPKKPKKA